MNPNVTKGQSGLMRPRYAAGLLLRDDDLALAVDYTRELNRLLFRSLFGCGVVCGLKVDNPEVKCGQLRVLVHKGVALDCQGNPIHVCEDVEVWQPLDCGEPTPECLWVLARFTEKCCAPRTAMCAGEEDDDASTSVCTRERDGFEIKLSADAKCACGCLLGTISTKTAAHDCHCGDPDLARYKPHYDYECACCCGDCKDCDCNWVVLARICYRDDPIDPRTKVAPGTKSWKAYHQFRRVVRPVIARDGVPATMDP